MKQIKKFISCEVADYGKLLRAIPASVFTLFVVSVILMNLMANKSIDTGLSWFALDCGLLISWLSFLCMDMVTKRFGAKASVKISLLAMTINLLVCLIMFGISRVPGTWGEYYTFGLDEVNQALDNTIGGTWYVLLGSSIAFAASAVVNAVINVTVGKLLHQDNFRSFAIRSYISTMLAQFVDNLVFSLIVSHVFFGWTLLQCITCSITGCLVELLWEVIFTPFGYKIVKQWEADKVGEAYINGGK